MAQISQEVVARRRTVIANLDTYVTDYRKWLDDTVEELGFTKDHLQTSDDLVECPFNSNHLMPNNVLGKHIEYCKWKQRGYTEEEVDDAKEGSSFFYERSSTVVTVKLDQESFCQATQNVPNLVSSCSYAAAGTSKKELPLTGNRAQYELNRGEKLAIYDHVRNIARQNNPANIISEQELMLLQDSKEAQNNPKKGKSYLERLAEERDFKRRRQSYRAKNVHITKKSHTEIIREVIANQMDVLGQMWEDEDKSVDYNRKDMPVNDDVSKSNKLEYEDALNHSKSREERHDHRGSTRYRSRSPDRRDRERERERRHRSRSRDRRKHKDSSSRSRRRSGSYASTDRKHKHKKHKKKSHTNEKEH